MGYWEFIVPEATTNLFTDPSFALADPDTEWTIAGDGAADFTRSTTYSKFGFSSALADLGAGTYADIYQGETTTATSYTVCAYVRRSAGGTVSSTETQARFAGNIFDWDSITSVGNGWYYCVYTGTSSAGAVSFGVRCKEDDMYVDAVQL